MQDTTNPQNTSDLTSLPAITSPKVAAAILGVSEKHARDLCARGEIPAVKLGSLWHINTAAFLKQLGLC